MALDASTDAASLAVLAGGQVVAAFGVAVQARRSQELFAAAEEVLRRAGLGFGDIDVFAAGRGPGAYTGLRVSLTAAQGWALPRGRTVWTISSAAARAAEILAGGVAGDRVVVWGQARRDTLWAGLFERSGDLRVERIGDWRLLPPGERGVHWPGIRWDAEPSAPRAEWVGRLFCAGAAGEERQPIYLHPAVAGT